jgi:hypothetical protein
MNPPDQPCQATPAGDLRQQILDSRVPKNEREWWASREIEKLERALAAEREKVRVLREALDEAQSCGGLTGSIFMQARAALAATEEKP